MRIMNLVSAALLALAPACAESPPTDAEIFIGQSVGELGTPVRSRWIRGTAPGP